MKAFIIIFVCTLIEITAIAQNTLNTPNILKVSDEKTTHLVCPDKVVYVQAGDYDLVQAEIVPELSNMVRIKAVKSFEKQTSLTVVCADRIYSFGVEYGNDAPITYSIEMFDSEQAKAFSGKLMPDYQLKDLCDRVLNKYKHQFRKRKTEKNGIKLRLNSIFLKDNALFFELQITNKTSLAYDVESFNYWITDKKKAKATNVQEYQVRPDYQHYHIERIPGKTTLREMFVFEKMTIPDQRILKVELAEKALGNTGRKLTLNLKNKDILNARALKQR